MPTALITGIGGQDGSYLTELLISRGYEVHGTTRRLQPKVARPQWMSPVTLHEIRDSNSLQWRDLLGDLRPDEVYHFAADSFVPNGWRDPSANIRSNLEPTIRILEAIREVAPETKLLNACSREIYGNHKSVVASENTPMEPNTPYGINKAAARWTVNTYRDRYGLFAANAILFNHESPRRGQSFVTRKITLGVASIYHRKSDKIELGSLGTKRDWGYAPDYVDAMWRMMQRSTPEDFVIGTGVLHTIADFAEAAFCEAGLDWKSHVVINPEFDRPGEQALVQADPSKACELLGWKPTISALDMARVMVRSDLALLQTEQQRAA